MAIPESQLQTWSNQGAITTSQVTHTSIRNALSVYNWPKGVSYDIYLQGSYRNSTNIRGDSDVDIVAEVTSIFWSNLTEEEKRRLNLTPATYTWYNFRVDVINALEHYYGVNYVDTSGSKSIKILPASGRLNADVIVAGTYKYYSNFSPIAEGITFWTNNQQIINYPKLHYANGTNKNSEHCTNGWYKPTVRMFKNVRNRIYSDVPSLSGHFPSYFIECLLYNVPYNQYGGGYQRNFINVFNWLNTRLTNGRGIDFRCQNGMEDLFGNSATQWNTADAYEYIRQIIILWNNW